MKIAESMRITAYVTDAKLLMSDQCDSISPLPSVSIIPLTDDDHQSVTNPPEREEGEGNSIMRQMWVEIYDVHRKL